MKKDLHEKPSAFGRIAIMEKLVAMQVIEHPQDHCHPRRFGGIAKAAAQAGSRDGP
jgi:hypothetical protein